MYDVMDFRRLAFSFCIAFCLALAGPIANAAPKASAGTDLQAAAQVLIATPANGKVQEIQSSGGFKDAISTFKQCMKGAGGLSNCSYDKSAPPEEAVYAAPPVVPAVAILSEASFSGKPLRPGLRPPRTV